MAEIIVCSKKIDCEHLLGKFLDENHYDRVIDSDVDCYGPNNSLTDHGNGEHNVLFKFRKNVFSPDLQRAAYEGLIGAAIESQNRGMAAGPKGVKLQNRDWVTDFQADTLDVLMNQTTRLDGRDPLEVHLESRATYKEDTSRGLVWLRSRIQERFGEYDGFFDRWLDQVKALPPERRAEEAKLISEKFISQTSYANPVNSGICGFFDRYPRIDWGRACAYNENNPELFAKSFPYLQHLDKCFKTLLPNRYANQRAACDQLDPRFTIAGTVFTTLTVNKTFRTAAHRDAGDLGRGFSNLGVISTGKDFAGGYLVLPEYRVAINIRPGDLLLIANHDAIHGNTPILSVDGTDDTSGVERMSVVAYFREKMLNLGSWEYEQARRAFIDGRRRNEAHPLWRPLWNGISPSWDTSDEWYEYLRANHPDLLDKYHPEAVAGNGQTSLESFFM